MKRLNPTHFYLMTICLLSSVTSSYAETSEVVRPQAEREQIIASVKKLSVKKPPVTKGLYDTVPLLFSMSSTGAKGALDVENIESLSDTEFLNLIIKQRVPKGIIRVDGQDYLSFTFGEVKAGGGFKGKYGTRSYIIYVLSIDKNTYTFKYNDEVKVIPFDASKGKLTKTP